MPKETLCRYWRIFQFIFLATKAYVWRLRVWWHSDNIGSGSIMDIYGIPTISPAYMYFPISLRGTFVLRMILRDWWSHLGRPETSWLESVHKCNLLSMSHEGGQMEEKHRPAGDEFLSRDLFSGPLNGNGNQRYPSFSLEDFTHPGGNLGFLERIKP